MLCGLCGGYPVTFGRIILEPRLGGDAAWRYRRLHTA
jgi:hypothetical protein